MSKNTTPQDYDGKLSNVSTIDLINELAGRYPYVCIIDAKGNKYTIELINN